MAWTNPNFTKEIGADGRTTLVLTYNNGLAQHVERFRINGPIALVELAIRARDTLANLIATDASIAAIAEGAITPATADVVHVPTAAEIARDAFLVDNGRWLAVKRQIDAGIIDPTDATVVALLAKVKAAFRPGYIAYI